MKISVICHGNIARSQILHHYLDCYADKASLSIDLFSCGTAPLDAYPDADDLLAAVRSELRRRGVSGSVKRNPLDEEAQQHLLDSDIVLVADADRKQEVLSLLAGRIQAHRVMLFYEFIEEGPKDFVDTYDADRGAQDPARFARCFDELERIAKLTVERIQRTG
jgi:protein-tyrosine-phosphatase